MINEQWGLGNWALGAFLSKNISWQYSVDHESVLSGAAPFAAKSKDAARYTDFSAKPHPSTAFRKRRGIPLRMLTLFRDLLIPGMWQPRQSRNDT